MSHVMSFFDWCWSVGTFIECGLLFRRSFVSLLKLLELFELRSYIGVLLLVTAEFGCRGIVNMGEVARDELVDAGALASLDDELVLRVF